jgi:hypothetical protein
MVELYLHFCYVFMAWALIKNRDNYDFFNIFETGDFHRHF